MIRTVAHHSLPLGGMLHFVLWPRRKDALTLLLTVEGYADCAMPVYDAPKSLKLREFNAH